MNTDTVSTSTPDVIETETNCTTGNVTETTTTTHEVTDHVCEDTTPTEEVNEEEEDDTEQDDDQEDDDEEEDDRKFVYAIYADDTIRGYVDTITEAKSVLLTLAEIMAGGMLDRYITRSEAEEETGTIRIYGRYRFFIVSYSQLLLTLRYQKILHIGALPSRV